MQLTVHEAARLLRVSDDTIYDWIRQEAFPASRYNEQYSINRVRLIEWAYQRQMPIKVEGGLEHPILEEALEAGGVHTFVPGRNLDEVLRQVLPTLPLPADLDREYLHRMLRVRRHCGWAVFKKGVAVPHPRAPMIAHVAKPVVNLSYLETPQSFGEQYSEPVVALFTIVAPAFQMHLNLLSRIGFALGQAEFLRLMEIRADRDRTLACLRRLTATFVAEPEAAPGAA